MFDFPIVVFVMKTLFGREATKTLGTVFGSPLFLSLHVVKFETRRDDLKGNFADSIEAKP